MSTGGGVPIRRENWGYMNQAVTVWLNGSADLLALRVAADGGENRPLVGKGGDAGSAAEVDRVRAKLATLLSER